jgi:uncharacterized protein (DUF1697 family)
LSKEATAYIGLLRAVNLDGPTQISMTALRQLLTDRGYGSARTLLQSGNIVFQRRATERSRLEERLEADVRTGLRFQCEFFVRSAAEWNEIVEDNPFRREAEIDPGHLLVTVFKESPAPRLEDALRRAIRGRERVHLSGGHAYFVYPDGVGRSKLTTALIERTLGTRGTSRNWNTVQKLQRLASG